MFVSLFVLIIIGFLASIYVSYRKQVDQIAGPPVVSIFTGNLNLFLKPSHLSIRQYIVRKLLLFTTKVYFKPFLILQICTICYFIFVKYIAKMVLLDFGLAHFIPCLCLQIQIALR